MENEVEEKKKKKNKTGGLLLIFGLTAVTLVIATYAWFVGVSVVTVNNFSVSIKSSDGLLLSLDGENFSTTLNLGGNENEIIETIKNAYDGSKNSWIADDPTNETGVLVPISTVGVIRNTSYALELYDKTSMTSSPGGYIFRASKVANEDDEHNISEMDGYVAFDIFLKNNNGGTYNPTYNALDDEAIYMTTDSSVTLINEGDDEDATGGEGLENSIRVAFMQIGRVNAKTATTEQITGITCEPGEESGVTSLCNKGLADDTSIAVGRGVTWNIWEPNDKKHTEDSVGHFTKLCKKRAAEDNDEEEPAVTAGQYMSTPCVAYTDEQYVNTYVVRKEIAAANNVDIYDGLNGYSAHIYDPDNADDTADAELELMDYYTDTEIAINDGTRPALFSVAATSITKIRIYIFLEGQDVDNFDISSYKKALNVTFGFTKDKFGSLTEEEPEEEPEVEPEP